MGRPPRERPASQQPRRRTTQARSRLQAPERDVVGVGRALGRLGGRDDRGLVAAGLGAVLERDVVDLVGDAIAAVAGGVVARLKAAEEGDRLALDQVLGGLGLSAPDDQVDVERVRLAVAAVGGRAGEGSPLLWRPKI
jgi:hypothetical protein